MYILNPESEKTPHERLVALEEKAAKQEGEIDALVVVLSDMLAAHAVLHKDLRLFSFIKENRDHNIEKEAQGGTKYTKASFFAARGELFARLLHETACSVVFDHYWFRSVFWWREEKERNALRKIRKAVESKRDG